MSKAKKTNEQPEVATTELKTNEQPEKVTGEVVNTADIERFEALDTRIGAECKAVESSMLSIMGALAVISEKNLHRTAGYKNARDYIADRHGMTISKGQLSDAINTFKKFGDMETGYLKDEWIPFTFSQLKLMRKLTDDEIAQITPDISVRKIQEMINANKAIEEKSEETAEALEETAEENVSRETNVTKEETSGEVEPYIEMTFGLDEFADMDAEALKAMVMEAFSNDNYVVIKYK